MADSKPVPGWAMYLRVSNEDKQTPERSFAFQRQRIEEFLITDSDIPFHREYCDVLTGTTPKRIDYQQMLADAEARKFSHLALYRADRFGRNALEGLQAATRLIDYGVKIRVAHMPSLAPETPDGFFMFMLQMGLAQREVEVMRQRINDGMDAKYRAGGWAGKAPEGYLNREEQVKSGKYYRWVEQDPELCKVLREAWELLLTSRYTVVQVCEELAARGYTRANARPWAWTDPKTGVRHTAWAQLHKIFHNPFYAGWVVSRKYTIQIGEVRGNWDPIITTAEYHQGLEVLRKHDDQKSRMVRHFYLLRNLLWIKADGTLYKGGVSTPTGKSAPYPYYNTRDRKAGKQIFIQCDIVDAQVPALVGCITIAADRLSAIKEIYCSQIQAAQGNRNNQRVEDLQRQLRQLKDEELHFARMLVTGKITEETYDRLRSEWLDKVRVLQTTISNVERESEKYIDDLDAALMLLSRAEELYLRLEPKQRATLLHIIFERIVVKADGKIVSHKLHSPFAYISKIADVVDKNQVQNDKPHSIPSGDVEKFLASLRFEQRASLADLNRTIAPEQ